MNTTEKYKLAGEVIGHAIKNGAQQASVAIEESRSNDIEIRNGQVDRLTESNRSGLTLRLYVDRKYSAHSTNRLRRADLFKFAEEAIAATRFLAEDEFRSLPDPELYYKGGGADLKVFDPAVDTIDPKEKVVLATAVHDEAFGKDERIISVSAFYSDSVSSGVLVTSNGFKGESGRTGVSLASTVSVKGDSGRPSDYWYESSLFFDSLVRSGIGEKALERATSKVNPKKIKSGKYPMLLENRVAASFLSPVFNALQGYNIHQRQSFLAGKAGSRIASPVLGVTDDPGLPSEPGSRLFDDEGLMAVKRPVIEKGILAGYYIDTYYGKKLGLKPTSGDSSNVIFSYGNKNLGELAASLRKGILVTGFNGGNCNGSTGDFSYGIEGFLVENGMVVHPVNEMNITGNMNDIWMQLLECGNDFRKGSAVKVPSLLIDAVDFSGI